MKKKKKISTERIISVCAVILFFAAWYLVTALELVDPKLIPTPKATWDSFVEVLTQGYKIGAKAGNMSLQITEELGFMNRPVIVSGCHDQIAAAIGSGVFNERHGVDGTGTVECITVAFSKDQKIDKMLLQKSGFAIVP